MSEGTATLTSMHDLQAFTSGERSFTFSEADRLSTHFARLVYIADSEGIDVPDEIRDGLDLLRKFVNASLDAIIDDTVGCLGITGNPVHIVEETVVWDADPAKGEDISSVQVFIPGRVSASEAACKAMDLFGEVLGRVAGIKLDDQNLDIVVHSDEKWVFYPCDNDNHEWHPVLCEPGTVGATTITRVTIERAF